MEAREYPESDMGQDKEIIMHIIILNQKKALSALPKLKNEGAVCYCLTDDYAFYVELREACRDKIEVRNLAGIFEKVSDRVQPLLIKALAELNKRRDSFSWWGHQIASRSSSATPMVLNIIHFFCAKDIMARVDRDIIFVTRSAAVGDCVAGLARRQGHTVEDMRKANPIIGKAKRPARYLAQTLYFLGSAVREHLTVNKFLDPLPPKKVNEGKRVVIRSWVTMGNFDKDGNFSDRNFGTLPEWLRSKGYEVWTLPIFFRISMSFKQLLTLLRKQRQSFLLPAHYLKWSDYRDTVVEAYKLTQIPVKDVRVEGEDVSAIINEILTHGLYVYMLFYHLASPMLKRLKEKGFEIDGFYYPFESLPPEKPFLLSCRKYFPEAKVIGFQHTTFFSNQPAYSFHPEEKDCHPLPDEIICSGPIYKEWCKRSGFPSEILVDGPNLRYPAVYADRKRAAESSKEKILLLPLTFSHDLAFELIEKVKRVVDSDTGYKVYIRTYFLLERERITRFLDQIGFTGYQFADEGSIQDWFAKAYAVISTSGSITTVEAACFGVPVIRVVPDSTFHMDAFNWDEYPLKPVRKPSEIRGQLQTINDFLARQDNIFERLADRVRQEFFKKPTGKDLNLFLLEGRFSGNRQDLIAAQNDG